MSLQQCALSVRPGALVDRTDALVDLAGALVDRAGALVDRAGALVDRAGALVDRADALVDKSDIPCCSCLYSVRWYCTHCEGVQQGLHCKALLFRVAQSCSKKRLNSGSCWPIIKQLSYAQATALSQNILPCRPDSLMPLS